MQIEFQFNLAKGVPWKETRQMGDSEIGYSLSPFPPVFSCGPLYHFRPWQAGLSTGLLQPQMYYTTLCTSFVNRLFFSSKLTLNSQFVCVICVLSGH